MTKNQDDAYSPEEVQRRVEATLRAAFSMKPIPKKDEPPRPSQKRGRPPKPKAAKGKA
jgi:hypothetical protein